MKIMVPRLAGVRKIGFYEREMTMSPDKVLVRHICSAPNQGTALHVYRGDHLAVDYVRETRLFPYPWLQGFAYGSGRVEEVGAEVKGVKEGDLVHCMRMLSELSVADPGDLTIMPEGMDPEEAAIVSRGGVALNGVRAAGIALGDTVIVTGQGPIGLFASQFCKLAGARKVIATDLYDKRLEVSRQVGVDIALNARSENVSERVMELTGGRGAEVAVDVSGSPGALVDCAKSAAKLARIAVVGWALEPFRISLAEDFSPKGLEIVICHGGRGGSLRQRHQRTQTGSSSNQQRDEDRLYISELILNGTLKAKELITHRFPLKDIAEAWEFIDNNQSECLEVLLVS